MSLESPRTALVCSLQAPGLRAIYSANSFGLRTYDTAALPDRLYSSAEHTEKPASIIQLEPALDVTHVPTPLEVLLNAHTSTQEGLSPETRRSISRLEALWLIVEDRYRLLDVERVDLLAHQASLVEHILTTPELRRVLIADEVGLGKTVEAGMLVRRLIEAAAPDVLRVLYLTEARLVDNVVEEFERLGLHPRRWTTEHQEARLHPGSSDPLVVASMHRAVYQATGRVDHFRTVTTSGPWDALIVDEAHHLTDWSADGGDPQQRMRLVRTLVREQLTPYGRLILLSGTPHQGNPDRFRNLLRLLSTDGKDEQAARGRVIYRIKEDIKNWDDAPLFPLRQVLPPTQIQVGPAYRQWLEQVRELLSEEHGSRAGAWRKSQALQWAASSPQAGLGYLVRLALRSGFNIKSLPTLRHALSVLRPYRGGSVDEPIDDLQCRLSGDLPAEVIEAQDIVETELLTEVLRNGAELVHGDAMSEKLRHVFSWLEGSRLEKFVIFAQPLETVWTLKRALESKLGPGTVAMIVGGQSPDLRKEEIRRFRNEDAVRVLVSSRSGGEGINLQVSRQLIHFDVPWNPMEMEQRVGRVHRYGGVNTVIVNTLVLAGSRELRVLDRCRARLAHIVKELDHDRFELLFSRTMALIPLEELAALMAGENFGPLEPHEQERVDQLVTDGFQRWQETDNEFRLHRRKLQTVARGQIKDEDFTHFLRHELGAEPQPGWRWRTLKEEPKGVPLIVEEAASVLRLADGHLGYVGPPQGLQLLGPPALLGKPDRLGLNQEVVGKALRKAVGDTTTRGVGAVLVDAQEWEAWVEAQGEGSARIREGALVLVYLSRLLGNGASVRELGSELLWVCLSEEALFEKELHPDAASRLMRMLRSRRAKRAFRTFAAKETLLEQEARRLHQLRTRVGPGRTAAVFPLAALWVEPG